MGLLTPKGKKGDKKSSSSPKPGSQGSKFIAGKGNTKAAGSSGKKNMTGGSQRGS